MIRNRWASLRALVGKENIRTEIMLTEAKVLGIREQTLVLGHSTGALANRLNAPDHNEVIVSVLKRELGSQLAVECIVGTNPAAAGFTAKPASDKPTWNPMKPAVPATPVQQPVAAESDDPEEPESPAQDTGGWGKPVNIGRDQQVATAPATPKPPVPAPVAPTPRPESTSKPSWREIAEQAAANASAQRQAQQGTSAPFNGGVPLPPEPEDFPPPPAADPYDYQADEGIPQLNQPAPPAPVPQQPAQPAEEAQGAGGWSSRSEEEEMMREAANAPGQMDRRDAKAIAMELLAAELGAKPL